MEFTGRKKNVIWAGNDPDAGKYTKRGRRAGLTCCRDSLLDGTKKRLFY